MKLIIAIVSNDDSPIVSNELTKKNFSVTRLSTTGGFLRAGNTTLMIGVEPEHIDEAIEIISVNSKKRTSVVPNANSYDTGRFAALPVEVMVGGATIFVVDVDKFVKV